jgi:hypothetical protein
MHASLAAAVHDWLSTMRSQRRTQVVLHRARGRWAHQELGAAFEAWAAWVHDQRRSRRLHTLVVARLMHASLAAAVHDWLSTMRAQRRTQVVLHRARGRWVHATMARVMVAWMEHAERSKAAKTIVIRALCRWRQKLCSSAFYSWVLLHQEYQQSRRIYTKVVARLLLAELSSAVTLWLEYTRAALRNQRLLAKAQRRWANIVLAKAMSAWSCAVSERRQQRRILARVTGRWRHKILWTFFDRWSELLSAKVKHRLVGDRGFIVSTVGFDDNELQLAMKSAAQRDFFANFRVYTPPLNTEVGSSWVIHALFDIQEVEPAPSLRMLLDVPMQSFAQTATRFVSVPSKILKQSDGPLQVLTKGRVRQIELVFQVATMYHFPSRLLSIYMARQRSRPQYPADISERRLIYSEMMGNTRELKIRQEAGANSQQLKIYAELPDDLLIETAKEEIGLLAFGFDVKFEGFSGVFRCKSLLAVKVFGSSIPLAPDEVGVLDERTCFVDALRSVESVLPKASYECATDEPAHYHRGKLNIELLRAVGVVASGPNPGPLYCKIFIHHKGKVAAERQSGLYVKVGAASNNVYPMWSEKFDVTVPNGDRDLLTIQVWKRFQYGSLEEGSPNSAGEDEYIAYTTVLLGDISSMGNEHGSLEQEWRLQRSDGTAAPAGLLTMTLKWTNIFAVGRTIDISSGHRKM